MNINTQEKVLDLYELAAEEYGEENIWVTMLYGSQNYGVNTELSDVDAKTMLLPSLEDVLLKKERESETLVDFGSFNDVKDYRDMFSNYLKGNINFLETLYTDYYTVNSAYEEWFNELRSKRDLIANARPRALVHMAAEMARNKNRHFENYEKPKDVAEIGRLFFFITRYIATMDFGKSLRLEDYEREGAMMIRSMKRGDFPLEEVKKFRKIWMECIEDVLKIGDEILPESNDWGKAKVFLDDLALRIFKEVIAK